MSISSCSSTHMAGAYGLSSDCDVKKGKLSYLPLRRKWHDHTFVEIDVATPDEEKRAFTLLNDEIESGLTWPHETLLDEASFRSYFLAGSLFVVKCSGGEMMGCFYVKPNFPGRCSHIANGGFIVDCKFRGRGVGKIMAQTFPYIARDLGYEASLFNLVFGKLLVCGGGSHDAWV